MDGMWVIERLDTYLYMIATMPDATNNTPTRSTTFAGRGESAHSHRKSEYSTQRNE